MLYPRVDAVVSPLPKSTNYMHKLYIERNTPEQEKPAQHFAFTLVFSYIYLQCTLHQSS